MFLPACFAGFTRSMPRTFWNIFNIREGIKHMSQAFSAHASFHRYRLNVITNWPESECKRAALAAAEAALQGELAFDRVARKGGSSTRR
jgi:hypothetical protein